MVVLFFSACHVSQSSPLPEIKFTKIPPQDVGGPDKFVDIEGIVSGAKPEQKIVLFAKSGTWWVQPFVKRPYTEIQAGSSWQNSIHAGTDYAALLVEPDYRPPSRTDLLPGVGDGVVAVATVKGTGDAPIPSNRVNFSGYEWLARRQKINRMGATIIFDPANAWTDERGFLHLRVTNDAGEWRGAKVDLMPTLGYGTYIFSVRDISRLTPSGALSLTTWDPLESGQNHREMILEVLPPRPKPNKNLSYIVQPYYQPMNVAQFNVPVSGALTHSIHWQQGTVQFKTIREKETGGDAQVLAEHTFTQGIPTSEGEKICIALFITDDSASSLEKETEVIIEKFEYLP